MIRAYANLIRKLHLCRFVPVRLMIVWPGFLEIYTSSKNFYPQGNHLSSIRTFLFYKKTLFHPSEHSFFRKKALFYSSMQSFFFKKVVCHPAENNLFVRK